MASVWSPLPSFSRRSCPSSCWMLSYRIAYDKSDSETQNKNSCIHVCLSPPHHQAWDKNCAEGLSSTQLGILLQIGVNSVPGMKLKYYLFSSPRILPRNLSRRIYTSTSARCDESRDTGISGEPASQLLNFNCKDHRLQQHLNKCLRECSATEYKASLCAQYHFARSANI